MIKRLLAVSIIVCAFACLSAGAARADSLFTRKAELAGPLFSDQQLKYAVGDLITVMVSESTDARTRSTTETEKESDLKAEASAPFFTNPRPDGLGLLKTQQLPSWNLTLENEFDGGGQTRRENRLTTVVSTRVTEVLDGGNLRVEGSKIIIVNRERTKMTVKGVVRARDITPQNTVLSSQMADAEIVLEGQGPLWNSERRGLLTRVLDWLNPF